MTATRVQAGVKRPAPVVITVDGKEISAYPGESLATAMLAAGYSTFRKAVGRSPRGPFCNMGVCFDCVVVVDGVANVRACVTPVRSGMQVERQGLHSPEGEDNHGAD